MDTTCPQQKNLPEQPIFPKAAPPLKFHKQHGTSRLSHRLCNRSNSHNTRFLEQSAIINNSLAYAARLAATRLCGIGNQGKSRRSPFLSFVVSNLIMLLKPGSWDGQVRSLARSVGIVRRIMHRPFPRDTAMLDCTHGGDRSPCYINSSGEVGRPTGEGSRLQESCCISVLVQEGSLANSGGASRIGGMHRQGAKVSSAPPSPLGMHKLWPPRSAPRRSKKKPSAAAPLPR
jgi:hypothetical protein